MSRIAIVHDYLTQSGGAERVVGAMVRTFPEARIHTSLYQPSTTFEFPEPDTGWLQRVPGLASHPKLAFPVLGDWFARQRIEADATIVSTSGWAHLCSTDGAKIVYTHTPARWLYRTDEYLRDAGPVPGIALGLFGERLRRMDRRAAATPGTVWLANSTFTAAEMKDHWGVEAQVLHPPAGIDTGGPTEPVDGLEPGFVLCVSRLLAYKNLEALADAASGFQLVIAGTGPLEARLREHPNAHVCGRVTDAQLRWLYSNCSMLAAVALEDFGLTPVEANLFGKPVVALRSRGYLDTVVEDDTGVFIDEASPAQISDAVERAGRTAFDPDRLRSNAERFSFSRFSAGLTRFVDEAMRSHH